MPLPLSNDAGGYDINGLPSGLPIDQPVLNRIDVYRGNAPETATTTEPSLAQKISDTFLGTHGHERYQLWPERLVRSALSAPHDVYNSETPLTSQDLIAPALDMSALAGTGGLAGVGEEAGAATLGAGPFLRPALKYEGKIYKAPMGGEHMDAVPPNLRNEFTKQAMSGEDISNFNFGFMNHKGQFLNREDALKYAIDQGLISEHNAKFGALTSTLMADSSKEGAAIQANRPYANVPDSLMGFKKTGQNKGFEETNYKYEQPVKVTFPDSGDTFVDNIKGLNKSHALERAYRNWQGAKIEEVK